METSFGPRGDRLWASLLTRDPDLTDPANPVRELANSACRAADRVDGLEQQCRFAEPVIDGRSGPLINPLWIEVRQQEAMLARLLTALRLPEVASGKRPQHRQMRGFLPPPALASLDRARARSEAGPS